VAEGFRSLAAVLRDRAAATSLPIAPPVAPPTAASSVPDVAVIVPAVVVSPAPQVASFCSDVALARVAALEAFERGAAALLERLAEDVLARELTTAPADVSAIVRRLVAGFDAASPVAIVAAPADAESIDCGIPVRGDPSLAPGDVVLVVRDGTVDARMALRLRQALSEASR
jgi:hypothetical protein